MANHYHKQDAAEYARAKEANFKRDHEFLHAVYEPRHRVRTLTQSSTPDVVLMCGVCGEFGHLRCEG